MKKTVEELTQEFMLRAAEFITGIRAADAASQARITAAEERVREYQREVEVRDELLAGSKHLAAELAASRARIAALEEALREWQVHSLDCRYQSPVRGCTCGMERARAVLEGKELTP